MTVEKASLFALVYVGSDSVYRAGCEEVNYNPAYKLGWEGVRVLVAHRLPGGAARLQEPLAPSRGVGWRLCGCRLAG